MKKKLLLLVLLKAMVITLAQGTQTINIVGYHRHSVDPGDLILVSPTLDHLEGNLLNDIIGQKLPAGSAAYIWDGLGYSLSIRTVLGGPWYPNSEIIRGQAFFLQLSATAPDMVTFAFTGEVPGYRNGGGTTTVNVVDLDATAYPYPVNIEFGQTQVASDAGVGSSVFFWNQGNQNYELAVKQALGGWGSTGTRMVKIGEAFFMEATMEINVDEVVPYDLSI